jgi:hypothetical protein
MLAKFSDRKNSPYDVFLQLILSCLAHYRFSGMTVRDWLQMRL